MSSDFWNNFLANFFSDILVGGLLAFWIGNRLNTLQRFQQRRDEKKAEIEKTIHYLEFLKIEITDLCNSLPCLTKAFSETGWGREVPISTPFWDILQPSGELPKLIEPHLLSRLALFYDSLTYARRGKDLVIESWLIPQRKSVPGIDAKSQAFITMTEKALGDAQTFGKDLPDVLDKAIRELRIQLEQQNT